MEDIYYEPIEETSLAELLLEDIRRVAIHEAQHVMRQGLPGGCSESKKGGALKVTTVYKNPLFTTS